MTRNNLKAAVVGRLDADPALTPLNHTQLAGRYAVTTDSGRRSEIMFEHDPRTVPNIWVERRLAPGLETSGMQVTAKLAADLWKERNAKGALMYGRHSGLQSMAYLADTDLLCIRLDTVRDLDTVLAAVRAA